MYPSLLRIKTFFISVVFLFLLYSNESAAGHYLGGSINYKHLQNHLYEVTLVLYRDCGSIPFPAIETVNVNSDSCNLSFNLTLDSVTPSAIPFPMINASYQGVCNGGSFPNMEKWTYRDTIDLTAACPDWHFEFSTCCRNNYSNALVNPTVENFHITATLNNTQVEHSSIRFLNTHYHMACLGDELPVSLVYDNPDNDSVVLSLVPVLGTNGVTLAYNPAYSFNQPAISNPAVFLSPANDTLYFNPTIVEFAVFAVKATEYKSGSVVGEIPFESAIVFTNCPSTSAHAIENEESIRLFPNPVKEILTIKSTQIIEKITLFDVFGRRIYSSDYYGKTKAQVNTQELSKGCYIIKVETADHPTWSKLLIVE